ncbi:SRPBCC domain-containing protein [Arsukibacterium sp.]|uniref:SRPBCC family protein n=1 Tax=Arsukibacterium sp. TaxID=1977258 RepID=UPI00299E1790|nr:SRPBCC domain-containing protein [Arsukibacterium sp.]MDX1536233.1 SRPBCC domain-containing protein [Arsukibacterium sp.]
MRNVTTINFSTVINAPVELVWQRMFDDAGFRNWTSAFCDGSYFEGSWQQGEPIRFLSPSGDGMVAIIAALKPLEFVSIKHLGFVVDGKDDLSSEQVSGWAPAFENYYFQTVPEGTEVKIEQEIDPSYQQFMTEKWPQALQKLKTLCEQI